jgi:hypothetical protein
MENLGIFYDHLVYFIAIGNIYGHLVYFVGLWYIFPRFGILDQEKSGNPGPEPETQCRYYLFCSSPNCRTSKRRHSNRRHCTVDITMPYPNTNVIKPSLTKPNLTKVVESRPTRLDEFRNLVKICSFKNYLRRQPKNNSSFLKRKVMY